MTAKLLTHLSDSAQIVCPFHGTYTYPDTVPLLRLHEVLGEHRDCKPRPRPFPAKSRRFR
jgi:hypothetical protein